TLQGEVGKLCAHAGKTVVLITNDVDEGILLADRIIPLSHGPRATLGPGVRVDIERPRDRKTLQHDPRWKRIRNQLIEYLLGLSSRAGRAHGEAVADNVLPFRPPIA